jgi:hypothetical protein
VGEWFDPKGTPSEPPPPLHVQRESAVHSLWVAVGVYAALGGVSAAAVCLHRLRGRL